MFKPISFEFDGVSYVIPAHRVLMAIAVVEVHITIHELALYSERKTAPSAKIAMAFAALVNFAGGNVTADQVWHSMFQGERRTRVQDALALLLVMLMPGPGDLGNVPPVPPAPAPRRKMPMPAASKRSIKR
jgi:hypothetical protein